MQPFQVNPTLHLPLNRLQSKASECARLSHLNSWRYWNQFTSLPLDLTWPSASESLTWLGSICVWFKSGSKIGAQRRDASLRRGRILGQTTWKYSLKGAVCPWICPLLVLLRLLKECKSLKMTRWLIQVKHVVTFVVYYDRNTPKTLINRNKPWKINTDYRPRTWKSKLKIFKMRKTLPTPSRIRVGPRQIIH